MEFVRGFVEGLFWGLLCGCAIASAALLLKLALIIAAQHGGL